MNKHHSPLYPLIALALIVIAIPVGLAFVSLAPGEAKAKNVVTHCAEDNPCWNWAKMGDRRRGAVYVRFGRHTYGPIIVTAREFCLMLRHHRVAFPQTRMMKGDGWAGQHACR